MLRVYINYPNPRIVVHSNPDCLSVQKRHKANQRFIRIELANLSNELEKFANGRYSFRSNTDSNDLWLEIELNNMSFEYALVNYVQVLLSKQHRPFSKVEVLEHCPV